MVKQSKPSAKRMKIVQRLPVGSVLEAGQLSGRPEGRGSRLNNRWSHLHIFLFLSYCCNRCNDHFGSAMGKLLWVKLMLSGRYLEAETHSLRVMHERQLKS